MLYIIYGYINLYMEYNMYSFHNPSFHIIVRVQTFIGLCMAMFFISKSNNVLGYDYGPSGIPASPTPIPTFITYGFDVLSPNGTQSNWLNHEMIHVETNRTSSTFYQTIYKSNLMYALDSFFDIYPSENYDSSMFESYIDEFMLQFDTYFPFEPHDPKYLINAFCSESSLYFTVDLNYNSFDIDPSTYSIEVINETNNEYIAYSNKYISTFISIDRNINGYLNYLSFEINPENQFGIQNKDYSHFYSPSYSYFGYIDDLGFQTPLNPNTYWAWIYGFNVNGGNRTYFEGHSMTIDTELFCPLVIFKPILTFDTFVFGTDPITYNVRGNDYFGYYWSVYLFPNINNYSDFEWFYTLYKPLDWFNKHYVGLTYTTNFEPVHVTPIPTFSVPFTPTPFPTNIFNPTVTPINLPLNPIIQIGDYGKPWDFIYGIIPILHSALNSGTVHLFVQTIEYIYNTSLFFEVILFLIPSICLLAFILGRLKRK